MRTRIGEVPVLFRSPGEQVEIGAMNDDQRPRVCTRSQWSSDAIGKVPTA